MQEIEANEPKNGKLANAEENDIWYYKGVAYRGLGNEAEAKVCFEQAIVGSSELQQAFFYNDQQPERYSTKVWHGEPSAWKTVRVVASIN